MKRITPALLIAVLATVGLAACSKSPAPTEKANPGEASASTRNTSGNAPLLLSPEDILTINSNTLTSGPSITGSVQPERRADLRAEVSAVVLQVLKENGDPVHKGDLLVRLDDTAIRDSLNSSEASARAAQQAYEQLERGYQRLVKLRESGMVSTEAVEDGETRRNNSKSDAEAAKTRVIVARQQLQRTEVRAPFDGIVSDRKVSAGDTAQVGKELLNVIDPHSMRFEGMVSADNIGAVKADQSVVFRVHGFGEDNFSGKIMRVNPAANVTTRQVEVLVAFADAQQQPKLAGLYAEGWIETNITSGLSLPANTLVKDGDRTYVWRLQNNALQKVLLQLGERDARSGQLALKSGLQPGDQVLRYPNSTLHDGQVFKLTVASTAPETSVVPSTSNVK